MADSYAHLMMLAADAAKMCEEADEDQKAMEAGVMSAAEAVALQGHAERKLGDLIRFAKSKREAYADVERQLKDEAAHADGEHYAEEVVRQERG